MPSINLVPLLASPITGYILSGLILIIVISGFVRAWKELKNKKQNFNIEELKKVKLNSEDILLVKLPRDTSKEGQDKAYEMLKRIFSENKIVFYTDDMEISVMEEGKK